MDIGTMYQAYKMTKSGAGSPPLPPTDGALLTSGGISEKLFTPIFITVFLIICIGVFVCLKKVDSRVYKYRIKDANGFLYTADSYEQINNGIRFSTDWGVHTVYGSFTITENK